MPSPHEVSEIEANLYYAGLSPGGKGSKLVLRTSPDVYEEPGGPETYKRFMKFLCVQEDHAFGKDGLWDAFREEVRGRLDE